MEWLESCEGALGNANGNAHADNNTNGNVHADNHTRFQ